MNPKVLIGLAVAIIVIGVLYVLSPKANAPTLQDSETLTAAEDSDVVAEEETVENTREVTTTPAPTQKPTPNSVTNTLTPIPKPTPEPEEVLPYNVTVLYDGGRFIPDEITIIEGGMVRFVNITDEEKMWVASDNHPIHNRYPIKDDDACNGNTFDQCGSVTKGESWSFTFSRTGTWGYHNHMRGKDTGDIRVMTVTDYLNRMVQS